MNVNDLTDEAIMTLVAKGDSLAFKELLNRYSKTVFHLAWRLCLNQSMAEDLTQDVFMKVWQKAETFQGESKLKTWLYRIAYNRFVDLNRQKKGTFELLSETIPSSENTPEEELLKKAQAEQVAKALEELPEKQKEVMILCYYQGLKAKEACEVLNITQSALEALLFRARKALKQMLCVNYKKGD